MNENETSITPAAKVVLAAFALSGAAALVYEVAWIRSLSLVLGSTTYAVSTMLAAFMAGLGLGACLGGRVADWKANHMFLFGLCELGTAIFGLLTIPAINSIQPVYFTIFSKFHLAPDMFYMAQFLLCFAIMMVPTVLMGATFPLVVRIVRTGAGGLGRDVGKVYSVNTLGAILGSVSAGFILIPLIGVNGATQAAVCLNLVVALAAIIISEKENALYIAVGSVVFIAALNFQVSKTSNDRYMYNYYIAGRYDDYGDFLEKTSVNKLVYSRNDMHGLVRVFRVKGTGTLLMRNGGKNESSTDIDIDNTLMLAYLPIAVNPDAKSFLGIGLGTGVTMHAAGERIEDVEWVEINGAVVEAVDRYFFPGMAQAGKNVFVEDARKHLRVNRKKYDIISSEPSYPTDSSTANLFTKEFFEDAAERLNESGVFCQWLPFYIFDRRETEILMKTFKSVFPHVTLWAVKGSDLLFIGSKSPFSSAPDVIIKRIERMNELRRPLDFKLSRTEEQVDEIVEQSGEFPFNTDDKPLLEFAAARRMLKWKAQDE